MFHVLRCWINAIQVTKDTCGTVFHSSFYLLIVDSQYALCIFLLRSLSFNCTVLFHFDREHRLLIDFRPKWLYFSNSICMWFRVSSADWWFAYSAFYFLLWAMTTHKYLRDLNQTSEIGKWIPRCKGSTLEKTGDLIFWFWDPSISRPWSLSTCHMFLNSMVFCVSFL